MCNCELCIVVVDVCFLSCHFASCAVACFFSPFLHVSLIPMSLWLVANTPVVPLIRPVCFPFFTAQRPPCRLPPPVPLPRLRPCTGMTGCTHTRCPPRFHQRVCVCAVDRDAADGWLSPDPPPTRAVSTGPTRLVASVAQSACVSLAMSHVTEKTKKKTQSDSICVLC